MIRHVDVQQKFAQNLDHTVIISKIGEILGDPLLLVGENYNQLAGYHMEMVRYQAGQERSALFILKKG